jgi:hypothetical protein
MGDTPQPAPTPAQSPTRDPGLPASEYLIAALVAALPFCVYLATMYPGLTEIGDATKFAFVGKVLGTPHAPGYPLYVMVSHLFSYLPWGTLAYRMNALSALFGACAVAISYLLVRRLDVGRMAAVAAALALGFGDAFWSRSEYAKYYTLNAALVAWGFVALLRWGKTLRPRDLYWTVAIFALASGNHLTIVGLLPALVLFPLLTAPRAVLRPVTLAIIAAIVLLGLTQYGFIWLRTMQGAPYLEARATNLAQLWDVMTARRFAHEIVAFSTSDLWSMRVPIIWGFVRREFGVLGLCLVAAGGVVLFRRNPWQALLLVTGAAGVAGLTANMGSEEDQGFMLPVFVLLWPLAGVAIDRLGSLRMGRLTMQAARLAAIALAIALPSTMVAVNYGPNNHHTDTAEEDYTDAILAAMPDGAAIIADEYRVNMKLAYKFLGEEVSARRGIGTIRPDVDSLRRARAAGRQVFALPTGRRQVLQFGARFEPFEFPVPPTANELYHQRPVFRLLSVPTCLDIGNLGWMDISATLAPLGRLSVRVDNYRAFDAEVVIWAAVAGEREAAIVGTVGTFAPVLSQVAFRTADPLDSLRLATRLAEDGVRLPEAMAGAARLVRASMRVNDQGEFALFGVDFGGAVAGAMARAAVDQSSPKRATVCTHEFNDTDAWPDAAAPLVITPLSAAVGFGAGWYDVERHSDDVAFRWTAGHASLIVPLTQPRAAAVTIEAEPFNYPGRRAGALTLTVNGVAMGSRPTPEGAGRYAWDVPADRWRHGLNELTLGVQGATSPREAGVSGDGRVLGVRVSRITLDARTAR